MANIAAWVRLGFFFSSFALFLGASSLRSNAIFSCQNNPSPVIKGFWFGNTKDNLKVHWPSPMLVMSLSRTVLV